MLVPAASDSVGRCLLINSANPVKKKCYYSGKTKTEELDSQLPEPEVL